MFSALRKPTPAFRLTNPLIENIQQVTITLSSTQTSNTTTITSVDVGNTMLVYNGEQHSGTGGHQPNTHHARFELTNATTLTAYRETGTDVGTHTIYVTVVEFVPHAITKVRRGTITVPATSDYEEVTIQPVSPQLSVISYLGNTATETTGADNGNTRAVLLLNNSTTVSAWTGTVDADDSVVAGYQVVQFNASVIASIEQTQPSINSGTSTTWGIGSVVMANTFLVHGGYHVETATGNHFGQRMYISLSDVDELTLERSFSTATDTNSTITIVQFKDGFIDVQRGTGALGTSDTQDNDTVTAVTTTKTFANWLGETSSVFTTSPDEAHASVELTTTTNVLTERDNASAAATTLTNSWEIVEFT